VSLSKLSCLLCVLWLNFRNRLIIFGTDLYSSPPGTILVVIFPCDALVGEKAENTVSGGSLEGESLSVLHFPMPLDLLRADAEVEGFGEENI